MEGQDQFLRHSTRYVVGKSGPKHLFVSVRAIIYLWVVTPLFLCLFVIFLSMYTWFSLSFLLLCSFSTNRGYCNALAAVMRTERKKICLCNIGFSRVQGGPNHLTSATFVDPCCCSFRASTSCKGSSSPLGEETFELVAGCNPFRCNGVFVGSPHHSEAVHLIHAEGGPHNKHGPRSPGI